jgi:hypothetical protein
VPNCENLAERLYAHARLYRHIAEQAWSETRARELHRLAEECTRAAAALAGKDEPDAAGTAVPGIANSLPAPARREVVNIILRRPFRELGQPDQI